MADEQQESAPEQEAPQEDPIRNLKAEFSRKHANMEAQQAETNAQLQAILAEVQKSMKGPEAPKKSARELVFDDPEEFVRSVEETATRKATEAVTQQYQASQKVQNTVTEFTQRFPEFAQEGSEAVMLATKYASQLPSKLKGTAEGAENAMSRAALELGLVAASKRKTQVSDEPVIGSRGSGQASSPSKPGAKIDKDTMAFAELLGADFNDPKFMAELNKAAGRKDYKNYK